MVARRLLRIISPYLPAASKFMGQPAKRLQHVHVVNVSVGKNFAKRCVSFETNSSYHKLQFLPLQVNEYEFRKESNPEDKELCPTLWTPASEEKAARELKGPPDADTTEKVSSTDINDDTNIEKLLKARKVSAEAYCAHVLRYQCNCIIYRWIMCCDMMISSLFFYKNMSVLGAKNVCNQSQTHARVQQLVHQSVNRVARQDLGEIPNHLHELKKIGQRFRAELRKNYN